MNIAPFFSKNLCRFAFTVLSITFLFGAAQAEVYKVTRTSDIFDNVCDEDCSLREAIKDANASPTDDLIDFDPTVFSTPQTIYLGSPLTINNNGSLIIDGGNADRLTISGNNQVRVFLIDTGAVATLARVTIKRGDGFGGGYTFGGGGIYNRGTLTLTESVVTENQTLSNEAGRVQHGGGIYNAGVMRIRNSRVEYNKAVRAGDVTQVNGGGIYNASQADLQIYESSIAFNTAEGYGGGLYNAETGSFSLINSTVSSNNANASTGVGGGIYSAGTAHVVHATISENYAQVRGSGVSTSQTNGIFNSRNSIYGYNYPLGVAHDFNGTMNSWGYNLIEKTFDSYILGDTTGNILGQNPQLQNLSFNGGFARSYLLKANSPAIDRGKNFDIATDQRNLSRPLDIPTIPNATGGDGSDIGAVEMRANEVKTAAPFDFEGDGKTDIAVFRPSNGIWWISRSATSDTVAAQFGTSTDKLVPADYTGDGKTDLAMFRPSSGQWFILRSEDSTLYGFQFGAGTDIPAPGDFDGDRRADATVYRPSQGAWFTLRSSDGGVTAQTFGIAEDQPAVADYDGDGKSDIAVFRPSTGAWWLQRSTAGPIAVQFGQNGDKTVQGDYTGDGKADIAFFRPSTGTWYILRSEDYSYYGFPFGSSSDLPISGDYDGDGKIDAAIFRPSNNGWYLMRSLAGSTALIFGLPGDYPIPNVYVR